MTNIYVGQYKDYVKNYYQKALNIQNKIDENNQRYSAKYAEEANQPVIQEAQEAYQRAKENINSVFEKVKLCLGSATYPNIEQKTSEYENLKYDSVIILTADDIESMVERYSTPNNFFMLRAIRDYIEKRKVKDNTLDRIKVYMPADHLYIYKSFGEGALSLIDSIYANPKGFMKLTLDSYADEEFCSAMYSVIGTGSELDSYKSHRIPQYSQHIFDSIKLAI